MNQLTHTMLWVVGLLLTGCATSPSARLYVIEPMVVSDHESVESDLTIVVGPISLTEQLNRKEILTRDHRYRATVAEFDRWAEPLDDNIAAVIAENLSALVRTDLVMVYPWEHSRLVDYTVRVQIHRFGRAPGGQVVLSTSWTIVDSDNALIKLERDRYIEPLDGNDIVATVAAMSRSLERLSRDMANELVDAEVAAQQLSMVQE